MNRPHSIITADLRYQLPVITRPESFAVITEINAGREEFCCVQCGTWSPLLPTSLAVGNDNPDDRLDYVCPACEKTKPSPAAWRVRLAQILLRLAHRLLSC